MNKQYGSIFLAGVITGTFITYAAVTLQGKWAKTREISEDINESCPGLDSDNAGKSSACEGCPNQQACASGESSAQKSNPAVTEISSKLLSVKHKLLVLSGKGGVGKSTVASQLSYNLARKGFKVGLLDIDICGPSAPQMFGLRGSSVHRSANGWEPVYVNDNLCVMSIGFLLPDDNQAVIWRGPKKNGLIKQFLTDVAWGELDYLIVDTPPGTSDEHLSIVSYLQEAGIDGAVIVTSPQEVALLDVRKEITFCHQVGVKVLGVIENMSGGVFARVVGGAKKMALEMNVPFVGSIPLDSDIVSAGEDGKEVSNLVISQSIDTIIDNIKSRLA